MLKLWSLRVYTNGDQNCEHRPCRHYAHGRHALDYVRKLPENVPVYVELLNGKGAVIDNSAALYRQSAVVWIKDSIKNRNAQA